MDNSEVNMNTMGKSSETIVNVPQPSTSSRRNKVIRRGSRTPKPMPDVIDDNTDFYYSVFRTKASALVAKPTERILKLAQPRPRLDNNNKPSPFEVSPNALGPRPKSRTRHYVNLSPTRRAA